ncbi:MAG: RlmE family RNA methyltransferase [Candidatus Methanomethyliaceae archaeon]|nr:RlmE family RNA methyltransferase [Candidatus Methanomethyliaceae archaeon]MDW7970896.1 RlmE family RNA methyltransferase [Nitrososphaerota archaeon]
MPSRVLGDPYYRKAKSLGYRSRAALKLLELSKRYKIMKEGDVVLDVGAAPGGWLQVARDIVGERGKVIGVDISPLHPLNYENVYFIRGDIKDKSVIERIIELSNGSIDVILSDIAPKFTGIHELDHARQIALTRHVISLFPILLKKNGNALMKIIMGSEANDLVREIKGRFIYTKLYKPKASRLHSSEIYLICKGWMGNKTI